MGRLDDRVAIVTGGGRGIGREIALALAAEGAAVLINDLGGDAHGEGADAGPAAQVAKEIRDLGGAAASDGSDVTDADSAGTMVQRAVDELGGLHVLVNCAGVLRDRMVFTMTDEDWDVVLRVHLRGHFAATRAACRHWRARFKATEQPVNGRVVCMTSEAGIYGNVGQTNYASAKAGIASFAVSVAREMVRYGVTANAIAPRARTRLTEQAFGEIATDGPFDAWHPANVAPLAVFLATDEGAAYSGQTFVAGGGVLQVMAPPAPAAELTLREQPTLDAVSGFVRRALGDGAAPVPFPDIGLDVGAHR